MQNKNSYDHKSYSWHIEGYILGKDNFDPAITFMIIRIFVLHISIYALNLFTFCALNIREKLKFKN